MSFSSTRLSNPTPIHNSRILFCFIEAAGESFSEAVIAVSTSRRALRGAKTEGEESSGGVVEVFQAQEEERL